MKLFICTASAFDYDSMGFVVAKSEDEVNEKFKGKLDNDSVWHAGYVCANEVAEVYGYKVQLGETK
ncbi:hypothetical protein [Bacillus wiedmannii]|uniref:hypothetical protein n=1 Tax=Bacillus wiedmannii TaxID=1890302 RepID=UPI000BEB6B55|nr:hypothetical protein [Bacillus wiedmannii]PEF36838.1 hypothetical protein CON72_14140 [Bacillus wiedmannii]